MCVREAACRLLSLILLDCVYGQMALLTASCVRYIADHAYLQLMPHLTLYTDCRESPLYTHTHTHTRHLSPTAPDPQFNPCSTSLSSINTALQRLHRSHLCLQHLLTPCNNSLLSPHPAYPLQPAAGCVLQSDGVV